MVLAPAHCWLVIAFLLLLSVGVGHAATDDDFSCSKNKPCSNGACCGASGYCGYGDTYCGKGCTSNCDATAERGQYSSSGNATCPLNVCRSQFGFCGTTSDFCGTGCQSNCLQPASPGGFGGDVRNLIIGYYKSWRASGDVCGIMDTSQIPVDGLNDVNFAFAYVTPYTYEIVPMGGVDSDLFAKVTEIKSRNPNLKVWVSIGGWDFNNNGYGLTKSYEYKQVLFSANKTCPGVADAYAEIGSGSYKTTMDYGISLIGIIKDFSFGRVYAFFNMDNTVLDASVYVDAHAAIQIQSQTVPILQNLGPFGAGFNIKGLWVVGPYFSVSAKLQSLATVSGSLSAGVSATTGPFIWKYPQSMNQAPTTDEVHPFPMTPIITPGVEANASLKGSITITAIPELGLQIRLNPLGKELINTQIKTTMETEVTLWVGNAPSDCSGAYYGVDASLSVDIGITDPLPSWTTANFSVFPRQSVNLIPMSCFKWASSSETTSSRRSLLRLAAREGIDVVSPDTETHSISRRSFADALFPDTLSNLISCASDYTSPTGDCLVSPLDDSDNPTQDGAIGKRDGSFGLLVKRGEKDPIIFCVNERETTVPRLLFPSSGVLRKSNPTFDTYGPLLPMNCDDYTFGKVATPGAADTAKFASEHILEWQILQDFLLEASQLEFTQGWMEPNPVLQTSQYWREWIKTTPTFGFCDYMNFWWATIELNYQGRTIHAIDILPKQFPGDNAFRSELVLLDKDTNLLKERIWGTGAIRKAVTMRGYINGDINRAINTCKCVMNAVKYMQVAAVEALLVKQAARIGEMFDTMETTLKQSSPDNVDTDLQYESLNIGDAWRAYMVSQYYLANTKQTAFLKQYVDMIKTAVNPINGGSGSGIIGGQQQNTAIKNRVTLLDNAYQQFLATPWTNPFPASWANNNLVA